MSFISNSAAARNDITALPKPKWKCSENGNGYLSFYGLKVTVFPNKWGGWTVCLAAAPSAAEFKNFGSEDAAVAFAEAKFLDLRASGRFGPSPPRSDPAKTERRLADYRTLAELPEGLRGLYTEIFGSVVHETEKAILYRPSDDEREYWLPRSQLKLIRGDGRDTDTVIINKEILEDIEPAESSYSMGRW